MLYSVFISFLLFNNVLLTLCNEWRNAWLDPYEKYHLSWMSDDSSETITFVATVQTKGWIGFGISPNGGMKDSDIVIAWVDDSNGKAIFHDRYATDESMPVIDESQDWNLHHSYQNSSHTVIKFSRPYRTCDHTFDRDITRDTMRVVYAYSDRDPKSMNDIHIHKHHERGTKSLIMVMHSIPQKEEEIVDNLQSFTLNVNNVTIPKKVTTYWCKIINLTGKNIHSFKYEKYITPGSEPFVHHIVVYTCNHPDERKFHKYWTHEGVDCSDYANMHEDLSYCFNSLFAWTVGGDPLIAPKDVAFPLGTDEETNYLMFQIHYDNPEKVANVIDSSGLKFYYTDMKRKYEAFTILIGSTFDHRLIIPPKQPNFQITGHCHPRCYENVIDKKHGLNVIAVMAHMHGIGKTLRLRHFRGNRELPWLLDENNYDFNFQTFRYLKEEVKVLTGDVLSTECTFDSTTRSKATLGGLSTEEEMCLSLLVTYPRIKKAPLCFSGLTAKTVMNISGANRSYGNTLDGVVESSIDSRNVSVLDFLKEKTDWNQRSMSRIQSLTINTKQYSTCSPIEKERPDNEQLIGYPDVDQLYEPKKLSCQTNQKLIQINIIENDSIEMTQIYWFLFILVFMFFIVFVFFYVKSQAFRNTIQFRFRKIIK